ncbi:ImmA/IrrE family metallo-endopeptidase [Bacteroides fragilis]
MKKFFSYFLFFGVSTSRAWEDYYFNQQLKVAFRISLAKTKEPYAISAWLRQGELQAANLEQDVVYSEKSLKELIPQMKTLIATHPQDFAIRLQTLCLQAGIKLIYTPCLPKAPINGATRWLNDTPCIQLSGRHKRNDIFWFSFFHEVGHILLHGKKDIFLENIDYTDKQLEKEHEADTFASKILLSPSEEAEIIKSGDYTLQSIRYFAEKFCTHPAIIVGRLQHLKVIPYWQDQELIEKVDLDSAVK